MLEKKFLNKINRTFFKFINLKFDQVMFCSLRKKILIFFILKNFQKYYFIKKKERSKFYLIFFFIQPIIIPF